MESGKSFFATAKGIAVMVVGVIGVIAIGLLVFGAHQGWFSSSKTPETSIGLEVTAASEEDKWAILKSPRLDIPDPDKIEEILKRIIPKEQKSVKDIKVLYSVVRAMVIARKPSVQLHLTKSIQMSDIIELCLPTD
jgi:hypothetical protein